MRPRTRQATASPSAPPTGHSREQACAAAPRRCPHRRSAQSRTHCSHDIHRRPRWRPRRPLRCRLPPPVSPLRSRSPLAPRDRRAEANPRVAAAAMARTAYRRQEGRTGSCPAGGARTAST
eukprot:5395031-Prymnesium_polylepis.2